MRVSLLAGTAIVLALVSACGGGSSPAAPSTATPTRVIVLGGNLSFGAVPLNTTATGLLTVGNTGNATLTFSSISAPCGSMYNASQTSGTVSAGQTVNVAVQFAPTAVQTCNGNITVTSDATSGINTISVSASGTLNGVPLFSKSGHGDTVFTLPAYVSRVHVTGHFVNTGSNSNFIVDLNGRNILNEILRNADYSGDLLTTGGGTVQISSSGSIDWTFTELR